jgi:hypothetical protein
VILRVLKFWSGLDRWHHTKGCYKIRTAKATKSLISIHNTTHLFQRWSANEEIIYETPPLEDSYFTRHNQFRQTFRLARLTYYL